MTEVEVDHNQTIEENLVETRQVSWKTVLCFFRRPFKDSVWELAKTLEHFWIPTFHFFKVSSSFFFLSACFSPKREGGRCILMLQSPDVNMLWNSHNPEISGRVFPYVDLDILKRHCFGRKVDVYSIRKPKSQIVFCGSVVLFYSHKLNTPELW